MACFAKWLHVSKLQRRQKEKFILNYFDITKEDNIVILRCFVGFWRPQVPSSFLSSVTMKRLSADGWCSCFDATIRGEGWQLWLRGCGGLRQWCAESGSFDCLMRSLLTAKQPFYAIEQKRLPTDTPADSPMWKVLTLLSELLSHFLRSACALLYDVNTATSLAAHKRTYLCY